MTLFNTRCPACKSINRVPVERISDVATCGKCKSPLFDGMPIEGTANNLESLLQSDKPIVIDFWAPWCNPCVGFSPIFEQVAKERMGSIRCIKIDTEANQVLASQYQIRSIPTIMLLKNGKRIDTLSGALPKSQFDAWLNEALNR